MCVCVFCTLKYYVKIFLSADSMCGACTRYMHFYVPLQCMYLNSAIHCPLILSSSPSPSPSPSSNPFTRYSGFINLIQSFPENTLTIFILPYFQMPQCIASVHRLKYVVTLKKHSFRDAPLHPSSCVKDSRKST